MNAYNPPVELYQRISPLLQEPLSTDSTEVLIKQLSKLQAIRYDLAWTKCQWLEKLLKERERMRMPKDKEYTDLDRKTMLDATTSTIESDYQFLLSLEDIVKERITLGTTILQVL